MAPSKRKNTSAAGASKRAKNEEWSDISKEIMSAEVQPEVRDMLINVLPLSLGEYSDHRHKYQEQMVLALEEVLKTIEESKSSAVTGFKADLENAEKQKGEHEEATNEANRQKEAKAKIVQEKKVALAAAAQAFRAARDAKNKAEDTKREDEKHVVAAKGKKDQYVSMTEDLDFLRTAVPDGPETATRSSTLISMMKKWDFEESLQIALPAVFAKQPEVRGQFDVIALEGLAKALKVRIGEQDAVIVAAEPQQKKNEADIEAAQESLKSATASQLSAAKIYEEVAEALSVCEKEAEAAQKAAKEDKKKADKAKRDLNNAEALLDIFRDGPMTTFKRLQQRTEPVAEEPTATEQEPVSEQPVVSKEVEQPEVAEDVAA